METKKYRTHPIYNNYGLDENDDIVSVKTGRIRKYRPDKYGYNYITIRHDKKTYTLRLGIFKYECANGIVEEDKVIDHIDNNSSNDNLNNLQAITQSENIKKKYIGGYTNSTHIRKIKGINTVTGEEVIYRSMNGAGIVLNIVEASVRRVCEGQQFTAKSKIDGTKYKFEYI